MKILNAVIFCPMLGVILSCASNGSKPSAHAPQDQAAAPAAPVQPTKAAEAKPEANPVPAPTATPGATAAEEPPTPKAEEIPKRPAKMILATLQGKSGFKLSGKVTLSDRGEGVKILIEVEHGKAGEHGAHIHERADCSAADGSSAGSHFNPQGHEHGLPDKTQRHLGDLGNITIGKDGKGTLEIVIPEANLKDTDPHSFIGRGLIVHDKKDDGGQPVGNAGGRIGCAEIK